MAWPRLKDDTELKPIDFPVEITSKRLILRKHVLRDATMMFAAVDGDRKRLSEFLSFVPATKSVSDQRKFIQSCSLRWRRRELFDYGIYRRSDGVFMGNIGVHSIDWAHECCELGYWVAVAFEGYGYVSEAVHALTKMCFAKGLHRVEIRCEPTNHRSAAVAERCGFKLEGHLLANRLIFGRYRDTLVFGRVRKKRREF
jgi:ribosomal-protein-serine acetyltransferase